MFRARDVIVVTVLMAVLAVIMSLLSLMKPPDSNGWNADSYGTRARGHKALFELLGELKIPVRRQLSPPVNLPAGDRVLVMWGPEQNFVDMEPAYLYRLRDWMKAGGQIVVAPGPPARPNPFSRTGHKPAVKRVNPIEALGVAGVNLTTVNLGGPPTQSKNAAKPHETDNDDDDEYEADEEDEADLSGRFFRNFMQHQKARTLQTVPVKATGELAVPAAEVGHLALPAEGLTVIEDRKTTATASGTLRTAEGTGHVLAATYRVGAGRLTVVADPSLLMNEALGKADNAVLAARMLARPGREVVFDEFYHGLTVRGNPLWLVTQFPYGLLALLTIAWVSLWAWRQAIHLGPPLAETAAGRRSIAEYVDAMGRLFLRAGSHKFLMRELRDGALWSLRHQLNLPPGVEGSDRVLAALQRRDPARAAQLKAALDAVDILILSQRKPSRRELIAVAGKVNACL